MDRDFLTVTVTPPALVAPAPVNKSLAPGFRFHPTDEELVRYYLRRKACGKPFRFQAVTEIDVYKSEPWELAGHSTLNSRDMEWYFFSPVDRKYGNGSRLNRATGQGYWKATGKDRCVRHKGETIGMKKTLVFHSGRAPDGQRTNWVMHEYRLVDIELQQAGVAQDAFVLCRIFQKSGLGPPNGDRYAPFIEEEWEDDAALIVPGGEPEEDVANVSEGKTGGNDIEQIQNEDKAPPPSGSLIDYQIIPFVCKRERTEDQHMNDESDPDPEPVNLLEPKRAKQSDANSSHQNGSEDSTTSQEPTVGPMNLALMEFPLLETVGNETSAQPVNHPPTFDADNLEKSVPPGYLKFISNLENEILSVSMERETLKIEVMRAQAMINILQSHIEVLSKDNEDLKKAAQSKSK